MGDPVATGLAASLAHPGSNLTGLSHGYGDIGGKVLVAFVPLPAA